MNPTPSAARPAAAPDRHVVVIPAGGSGARFGAALPKQYCPLADTTVLERTVARFVDDPAFAAIHVAVAPDDGRAAALPGLRDPRVHVWGCGGASRRDTVANTLALLTQRGLLNDRDWVWVHDAARPGVDAASLARLRAALDGEPVGALLAQRVVDTVKQAEAGSGRVARTLVRETLWLAQTPQVFRLERLAAALAASPQATDEASAIEAAGGAPRLIEGSRRNLKITTPEDLGLMELWLREDR